MRSLAWIVAVVVVGLAVSASGQESVAGGRGQTPSAWQRGIWPGGRVGRQPSVKPGTWGTKWGTIEYGHKVEHCALSPKELAATIGKVVPGHPRLLLRPGPWKGGLSLDQFRQRVETQP